VILFLRLWQQFKVRSMHVFKLFVDARVSLEGLDDSEETVD
jgi:hypothetical protein